MSDATASAGTDRDPEAPAGRHRGPALPEPPDSETPPSAGRHRRPTGG